MRNSHVKRRLGALLIAGLLTVSGSAVTAKPEHGKAFKDWQTACEKPPAKEGQEVEEQCYIFQNISMKDTKKRLLLIAIGYVGGDGKPAAIMTLPLGILLPPGVGFTVGDSKPQQVPVRQCIPNGCRAVLQLSDALIANMKKGTQAQVTLHDMSGRPIGVPVSLLGFTAGFNSLKK